MNETNNNRYTAQQAADILGVYKQTLFNWEKSRKIPRAKRDPMNNYRIYTDNDVKELRKITKR